MALKYLKFIGLISLVGLHQTMPSQPHTVFIHSWLAHPGQAKKYYIPAFCTPSYSAPAMPDTQPETSWNPLNQLIAFLAKTGWNKHVPRSHIHFGTGPDLETIQNCIQSDAACINKDIILYGICRGAYAALNYLAEYNPDNIKALILDSSPADVSEILFPRCQSTGLSTTLGLWAFHHLWPHYSANSVTAKDNIANIQNKNIPVLILHSRQDIHFPFKNALELYVAFKQAGFKNVHLAALSGFHGFLARDDKNRYLQAVHTFYQHYNFAYNPEYTTSNPSLHDAIFYTAGLEQAQQEIEEWYQEFDKILIINQQKLKKNLTYTALGLLSATIALYQSKKLLLNRQPSFA
jgi:pimeloyl-ACP methyl ester carboxylesterase